jgi:CHAT domain-containing protein
MSLHSLALLWERNKKSPHTPISHDRAGLLLGLSKFKTGRPSLPQAAYEIERLSRLLKIENDHILADENATWESLLSKQGEEGLSHLSFCHIATHGTHDKRTGRLSGIALYDQDIWLDQLWECAPLPQLVTLSACDSSRSIVYAGDEHVGLPITCLAAGAQTIIGSLWPIRDEKAPQLMVDFYTYRLAKTSPAQALAMAQQQAIRRGDDIRDWSGFLCRGEP